MIDLHLHTTASDGTLAPDALVRSAAEAGLTVLSVTDHDTTAGTAAARAAAEQLGVSFVAGIEITAVETGRDVHVLGYFLDIESGRLATFLQEQREDRIRRVRAMTARLRLFGYAIDVDALIARASHDGRSVGRPALADALVAAGHVQNRDEAFDRLLAAGRPAYVPRAGVSAADVIRVIHEAGGISSLAHPGITAVDALIPSLAAVGLDALEARHSDHPLDVETHYRALASRYGLAVSGGSDFHGADDGVELGTVGLPVEDFAALRSRAAARA